MFLAHSKPNLTTNNEIFEELLADAADSLCETETTENYSKTGQPESQINAKLEVGDIFTFTKENRNHKRDEG